MAESSKQSRQLGPATLTTLGEGQGINLNIPKASELTHGQMVGIARALMMLQNRGVALPSLDKRPGIAGALAGRQARQAPPPLIPTPGQQPVAQTPAMLRGQATPLTWDNWGTAEKARWDFPVPNFNGIPGQYPPGYNPSMGMPIGWGNSGPIYR